MRGIERENMPYCDDLRKANIQGLVESVGFCVRQKR